MSTVKCCAPWLCKNGNAKWPPERDEGYHAPVPDARANASRASCCSTIPGPGHRRVPCWRALVELKKYWPSLEKCVIRTLSLVENTSISEVVSSSFLFCQKQVHAHPPRREFMVQAVSPPASQGLAGKDDLAASSNLHIPFLTVSLLARGLASQIGHFRCDEA